MNAPPAKAGLRTRTRISTSAASADTSGSTGKPKGIQHASAGYLLQSKLTSRWVFDLKPSDVFWCTADVGWVTGHSYVAYGPLAAGTTMVMYEGAPTFPDGGRFWKICQDLGVTILYTAPTAILRHDTASAVDTLGIDAVVSSGQVPTPTSSAGSGAGWPTRPDGRANGNGRCRRTPAIRWRRHPQASSSFSGTCNVTWVMSWLPSSEVGRPGRGKWPQSASFSNKRLYLS